MVRKKVPDAKKRFVGTWKCCDGFSDVRISLRLVRSTFQVLVVDEYDSEKADVYDIGWNEKQLELSFAVHWSSGRFVRYRFTPSVVDDRLELTFTYTDQEIWERDA